LRSEVCKEVVLNDDKDHELITELGFQNSNAKWFHKETTLIALVGATKGKTAFLNFKATTNQNIAGIFSKEPKLLLNRYIFECLKYMYKIIIQDLSQYDMLNLTQIKNIKIPVPPTKVQKQIIAVSILLDNKIDKAQKEIKFAQLEIDKEFNNAYSRANRTVKFSDDSLFDLMIGKRVLEREINYSEGIPVYSANVYQQLAISKKN
jgi:restriction endonuclease S subunit